MQAFTFPTTMQFSTTVLIRSRIFKICNKIHKISDVLGYFSTIEQKMEQTDKDVSKVKRKYTVLRSYERPRLEYFEHTCLTGFHWNTSTNLYKVAKVYRLLHFFFIVRLSLTIIWTWQTHFLNFLAFIGCIEGSKLLLPVSLSSKSYDHQTAY